MIVLFHPLIGILSVFSKTVNKGTKNLAKNRSAVSSTKLFGFNRPKQSQSPNRLVRLIYYDALAMSKLKAGIRPAKK